MNGKRLIDGNELYTKICELEGLARNRYLDTPFDSPARPRYAAQLTERATIKNMVGDMPTIDAAIVVRGEWLYGCRDGVGTEYCYCSECDENALKDASGFVEFSDYCPSCGAKMDKGEAE